MHSSTQALTSPVPSKKRIRTRYAIAVFLILGIIGGVIANVGDLPPVPDDIIGSWTTTAQGYEGALLVMTKHAVVFSAGGDHLDAQAVRRLEAVPDGRRVLYTLVYGNARNEEQTLLFFYDAHEQTITFKNQSHLIWTRTMVES